MAEVTIKVKLEGENLTPERVRALASQMPRHFFDVLECEEDFEDVDFEMVIAKVTTD